MEMFWREEWEVCGNIEGGGGCERFDQWHSMLVGVADGSRHFIVSISFVDPVWMFPCVPCQDVFVLRRDTENTRFCRKVEPTHRSEKLKVTNIPFARHTTHWPPSGRRLWNDGEWRRSLGTHLTLSIMDLSIYMLQPYMDEQAARVTR